MLKTAIDCVYMNLLFIWFSYREERLGGRDREGGRERESERRMEGFLGKNLTNSNFNGGIFRFSQGCIVSKLIVKIAQ